MRFERRELAAIFAGGFAGAIARAELADAFPYGAGRWPWVTLAVNIAGAFLLGYFATRLQERLPLSSYRRPLLGTGFCGALTTFSTMQLELVRLLEDGDAPLALAYAAVSIAAGFIAVTVATKLVRHFVADNPPQSLVDRVAAVYMKTDGDIREMLKTIFFSNEFNSKEAYRAKIKRPFELVVSAIRTLGADTNGGPGTHQWIARMGEPLYGFQTPNGYSDAAESWVNTGGLLERMNFGLALASNRIPGTKVDLAKLTTGEMNQAKVMDESLKTILAGEISAATRETLLKQLAQTDPASKVVGLILGTPEFQRQ